MSTHYNNKDDENIEELGQAVRMKVKELSSERKSLSRTTESPVRSPTITTESPVRSPTKTSRTNRTTQSLVNSPNKANRTIRSLSPKREEKKESRVSINNTPSTILADIFAYIGSQEERTSVAKLNSRLREMSKGVRYDFY